MVQGAFGLGGRVFFGGAVGGFGFYLYVEVLFAVFQGCYLLMAFSLWCV